MALWLKRREDRHAVMFVDGAVSVNGETITRDDAVKLCREDARTNRDDRRLVLRIQGSCDCGEILDHGGPCSYGGR